MFWTCSAKFGDKRVIRELLKYLRHNTSESAVSVGFLLTMRNGSLTVEFIWNETWSSTKYKTIATLCSDEIKFYKAMNFIKCLFSIEGTEQRLVFEIEGLTCRDLQDEFLKSGIDFDFRRFNSFEGAYESANATESFIESSSWYLEYVRDSEKFTIKPIGTHDGEKIFLLKNDKLLEDNKEVLEPVARLVLREMGKGI